jgi:RNA polymerase-binding transcription factor DksA
MSATEIENLPDTIRDMLLRERTAVLARMDAIAKDALALEFDGDGIPASSYGQEQALSDSLEARLATVEAALERLDDGTYGICSECQSEIPPRRLQALPFAVLCVQCQSLEDKRARARAVA